MLRRLSLWFLGQNKCIVFKSYWILKLMEKKLKALEMIARLKSFKFVGVHFDEFVAWEHHMNSNINKVSSANYELNQLKKFRKTIYNSLVK